MDNDYRYLNRGNRWLDFTWDGLQLGADGALRLAALPRGSTPASDLTALAVPDAPAGVAAGPDGDVYYSDPDGSQVLVVDRCGGSVRTVLRADEVQSPRGLLYHPTRKALLIADSGANRVLVYDLAAGQIVESWDGFAEPRSLAGDPDGNVYVVDYANQRVRKLDEFGRDRPQFWGRVAGRDVIAAAEVATGSVAGNPALVILTSDRVYIVDTDGRRLSEWTAGLHRPMGLAASTGNVYLGDNEQRRLLVYGYDGVPVGAAYGWAGPVAALSVGVGDRLYVHSGGAIPPSVLTGGAFRSRGLAWGGPFHNPSFQRSPRHLMRAAVTLAPDAHVQLYLSTADTAPPVDPNAEQPFADERWRPIAPDATETLFAGEPLDTVWIGVVLSGSGLASPALWQIRLDFAHETLLRYLPALYREDQPSREFLAPWLTLFESTFDAEHQRVAGLATLFDPAAAPARFLPWLAGWLALDLPPDWPEPRKRQAIADAFASYAHRGTVEGLRATLQAVLGVPAVIEEPIVQTGWWVLPGDDPTPAEAGLSVLGASTVLAAAEPQGAVLGTTAVLDGSFVAPQEEYAKALFAEVAHQFTVRLYHGKRFSDSTVADARALLLREAPAHTRYHVCVVEPYLRIGVQARVGVDAIVGQPLAGKALDVAEGGGLLLGGEPPRRLGRDSELGHIHLTDA